MLFALCKVYVIYAVITFYSQTNRVLREVYPKCCQAHISTSFTKVIDRDSVWVGHFYVALTGCEDSLRVQDKRKGRDIWPRGP